jgi:tetratricopeptide (TPR) repeat protein
MNENPSHTESLIQYMDGDLSGSQLEDMKKVLEENVSSREELEKLQFAKDAAVQYGLKNRIGSIHKEMMHELRATHRQSGKVTTMVRYIVRIAAVLILLFGVSALYEYLTATPEKLFNENFKSFNLRETRGAGGSSLEEAYKKGHMEDVIAQFYFLNPVGAEDYFLAGNAFLSHHEPVKAIRAFLDMQEKNKAGNTHEFEEDAEYYLALGYLENNEPEKALPILGKIRGDENHPYHKKVSAWFLRKVQRSVSVK